MPGWRISAARVLEVRRPGVGASRLKLRARRLEFPRLGFEPREPGV